MKSMVKFYMRWLGMDADVKSLTIVRHFKLLRV